MSVNSLVEKIKEAGEDFEWYPTTEEMVERIVNYINVTFPGEEIKSVLDIGCGNGSFLQRFEKLYRKYVKKYGIEKSPTLVQEAPDDVVIVGTDLFQQSLLDKDVSMIFCNPPYSQYKESV